MRRRQASEAGETPLTVHPFAIAVSQEKLAAIRARLEMSQVGYAPADDQGDWRYGTDARYLAQLQSYWLNSYDWRAHESALNAFPQFKTRIEDVDIHFYHVPGSASRARPLILTHGWPGSVVEFLDVIERLTHPELHGGDREDGFDLVVPSLPGYGFSSRPASPIGPRRIARLWRKLMVEALGYARFGAQGGDWGSGVTAALGREHADVVAAIHLNFLLESLPASKSEAFQGWRTEVAAAMRRESAYMYLQRSRPQTIGLALADSPLGFACWVVEKFQRWGDVGSDIEQRFTKDKLITNIMIYLVNDAVQSALWLYHGVATEDRIADRVQVPTGFAAFPAEFLPPPPREAFAASFNLQRWTSMPAGGHFAAMEEPVAFAEEITSFFRDWL